MAVNRQFRLPRQEYEYFEMPLPGDFAPKEVWRRRLRNAARTVLTYFKAKRYRELTKDAEVVHFQQILNAFGSKALFHWLNQPSFATRVVTVHELDPDQLESPGLNKAYNNADAIIVHCEEMRQQLIGLKVPAEKTHVVLHGTELPPVASGPREGIVFYGAHFLTHGKGIDTLFKALAIVHKRMGASAPKVKIHGYYGPKLRVEASQLAQEIGVADQITWLDEIDVSDIIRLYQSSQVMVLPYTGSFAGLAASLAAACSLPVVGTRRAGLPDHLGQNGIWVDEKNHEQLASKTIGLLTNEPLRHEIGARLRSRAEQFLGWDRIADRTLQVYEESTRNKEMVSHALRLRRHGVTRHREQPSLTSR